MADMLVDTPVADDGDQSEEAYEGGRRTPCGCSLHDEPNLPIGDVKRGTRSAYEQYTIKLKAKNNLIMPEFG